MNNTHNKKNVVILGAGGHANVIADIISAMGEKVVAFLDDDQQNNERSGSISDYVKFKNAEFIIGIGNADIRESLANSLNVKWFTASHPSAIISPSAVLGKGTVVMPNAVINARAVIGNHCIINTGAIVEHDNIISDYVHISVGAKLGGTVTIGKKTWIGIGSTVKNNVNIFSDCMIGAGATVVDDISTKGTYVGIPARKLK